LAIFATGFTLKVLLIFLGLYLLLDGLFAIVGALLARDHKNWWMLLLEGVISLGAGVVVFFWPAITLLILVYLVAIWAVVTGIFEFLAGIAAPWAEPGKIFIGIVGVLSVILGVIIFMNPAFSLSAVTWLIGIYALVIGLALVFFSFKLKALNSA
jgi:uncharacterized membrane protein HdeD (DUF308 family)